MTSKRHTHALSKNRERRLIGAADRAKTADGGPGLEEGTAADQRRRQPLSREQGILAFNERVLSMAENQDVPLLERLRYLTIVSGNLDELFEIRVAELQELARVDT